MSKPSITDFQVHYTELAEADLDDIDDYTLTRYGDEQRDLYMRALEVACEETLPAFQRVAQEVPQRPDLRRWRCERHVIYFRRVSDGIEVVRILHERMLPERHLGH